MAQERRNMIMIPLLGTLVIAAAHRICRRCGAPQDAQATIGVKALPLTPWQGRRVVALWTAGALLSALVLKARDA
jgi:hypothetical protein